MKELLNGNEWIFVELDEQEQETFTVPENRLDYFGLVLRTNSTGYYTAYGSIMSEEFWTEEFLLTQLIA